MGRILRFLPALLFVVAVGVPASALARGHGGFHGHRGFHSHVFLGFGCCGFGPGYYYPAYSPYYYGYPYPTDPYPYAYSAPPSVVYQQAPAANCRSFNGNTTIDASGQPFYGTACLGSDGRWHITQQ